MPTSAEGFYEAIIPSNVHFMLVRGTDIMFLKLP